MDQSIDLLDGLDIAIPAAAEAVHPQGTPEFFGPYQLIQEVGVGGVARVLRARHIHPRFAETTFAVKILHEELSRDPSVVSLFRAEAYVLAMLNHANIVRTFEAGLQDDRLFIAMEYIDGRDLDEMLARCRRMGTPLPMPVALFIIGEVLEGLAYAHELEDADDKRLNLVHRDANPANVFLSYDGRVKLGDFGVAAIAAGRVEKSRETAGKVGYFAPEQIAGGEVDQRADLFAIGVMMFEVLCGERLFDGDTTDAVMRLNKRAKIPKPSKINPAISRELEAVMLKALERRPADRFASAREMLAALRPYIIQPAAMAIAVAALMRKVFLREHLQELQLREGLAGVGRERGSGQLVALFTRTERAQEAFNELLLSRGYRVETHDQLATLAESVGGPQPPAVALMDVSSPGFTPEAALEALNAAVRPLPVVAVSDGLEPSAIVAAHTIGAMDLLYKPFNIERALSSVRAAITGAARLGTSVEATSPGAPQARPRLLIVSADPGLAARLSAGLAERDFDVQVSPNTSEAIERINLTSFNAVIYDAHPASSSDHLFTAKVRGQPGMGLVPIVYLAEPSDQGFLAGIDGDRSAVRSRGDPVLVLVETLNRLRADNRLGRTFVRYSTSFPAEVRYGGRVFTGEAIDISRGGVMLRCDQMPRVGTEVSVVLRPPTAREPIEAKGRVIRVDLPAEAREDVPGIGVEFERFFARSEAELIAYLGFLDRSSGRTSEAVLTPIPTH